MSPSDDAEPRSAKHATKDGFVWPATRQARVVFGGTSGMGLATARLLRDDA